MTRSSDEFPPRRMAATDKPETRRPSHGGPATPVQDESLVDTLSQNYPEGALQLVVLTGRGTGQSFPLRSITTVGRDDRCHITIADSMISREHALIHRVSDEQFAVEDLDSRNGTWVNGTRVKGSVEIGLGDRVQLGPNVVAQVTTYQPIERQLTQRGRLETMGRLASGVAHDLNNLLAAIVTNLACIEEHNLDDDQRQCLADIGKAASNAANLTPRLIDFVRPSDEPPQRVDVSAICKDVERLMKRTVPANVTLRARVEPRIAAMGNAADLYHALINLCINGSDAMPTGGTLEIAARRWDEHAEITVTDDGTGIEEEALDSVFEPFFSTKGDGSGLGLVTVRETAKAFGGEVVVESRLGQGTTFRMRLPAVAAKTRSRETPLPFGPLTLSGGRVLVAEDDQAVAKSLRRLLQAQGAKVQVAESGEACLETLGLWRPDVIIVDLDLPGMSGEELLAHLKERNDSAQTVIHSGDAHRLGRLRDKHGSSLAALAKPADPSEIVTTVGRALADAREHRRRSK